MDLNATSIPNPYGLEPSDFDRDQALYERALGFLSSTSVPGVSEEQALASNGSTSADLKGWEQSRQFRRALRAARAFAEQEREFEERQLGRDPFRDPPPRGGVDVSQVARGVGETLVGFMHRIRGHARAQAAVAAASPPGQRFLTVDKITDGQWNEIHTQNQPPSTDPGRRLFGGELDQASFPMPDAPAPTWNGEGLSPDGSQWG